MRKRKKGREREKGEKRKTREKERNRERKQGGREGGRRERNKNMMLVGSSIYTEK